MSIKFMNRTYKNRKFLNNSINIKAINVFLCVIFLIGTICGSLYINNFFVPEEENSVFLNSIENLKEKNEIFKQSIFQNTLILLTFWILGLSILGGPLLIFIIFFEGFSIGITTSYILMNFGFYTGYTFIYLCMYLNTVLNMIALLWLSISSFKVTFNVFRNIRSIKAEFIRHSTNCLCALILLFCSSFVEVNLTEIGKNLLF